MIEINELLLENGIIFESDDKDEPLSMDSLTFASLIISVENKYDLTVPLDMLLYEKWKTVSLIEENVISLLNEKESI